MNIQDWFPLGWTGWISLQSKGLRLCSLSINSLVLSFLYGPTLPFVHDYWKNHSFDYTDLCCQSNVSAFCYAVWVCHSFPSKEQALSAFTSGSSHSMLFGNCVVVPGGSAGKVSACNTGDAGNAGLVPGLGRSSGEGNGYPLQYFLPRKFHGQRSLAGYSPWGGKSQTLFNE